MRTKHGSRMVIVGSMTCLVLKLIPELHRDGYVSCLNITLNMGLHTHVLQHKRLLVSLTSRNTCKEFQNLSVTKMYSIGFTDHNELPHNK